MPVTSQNDGAADSARPSERGFAGPRGAGPGGGPPGAGVLWQTLREVVAARGRQTGRPSLDIVDVGGGTGGFAVPLASLGHRVTVIDPSPNSLATAQRRAAEAGVPLSAVQGDVSDLSAIAGGVEADLVLCHSVLEYVDAPDAAMIAITGLLRPGGVVSVLAASAVATVIHRVLAGRFDEARRLIAALEPGGSQQIAPRKFTQEGLVGLIEGAGLRPGPRHGVRVFTDLVPSMLVNTDPGAAEALLALEETASVHPAFRGLATQLHVLGFR